MQITVNVESMVGVGGVYSFAVYGPGGELRRKALAHESPNLITNAGLDALGGKHGLDYQRYCCVGSGSTTPAVTDTAIESLVAAADYSTAKQAGTYGTESASPYYTWISRTWRFGEGVATGNLSEVTVGWSATGAGVFSRALILDELGDPTTLTILADETLDVTYEFRYYPKLTDDTGTGLVFGGNIGGTYDWTLRSSRCGVLADHGEEIDGWGLNWYELFGTGRVEEGTIHNGYKNDGFRFYVFDGVAGPLTGLPSGNSIDYSYSNMEAIGPLPYLDGSYEREWTFTLGFNQGNLAGGIRSVALRRAGIGSYQMQLDPAIPKTSTDKLTINFKLRWGRI